MGAQCSVDGSYTLGEPFDSENEFWKIFPAVNKKDGAPATVFIHEHIQEQDDEDNSSDRHLKYLRILRHPGLLKCEKVFESSAETSVVTEPLLPLQHLLGELNMHEIIAGIHSVTTTVTFLHEKCKLSHNNLCLDSIFVGQNDACWKVGALECMTPFGEMTKQCMDNIKYLRNVECIPPESEDVTVAHGQDAYGLGKLILDIFDQIDVSDNIDIENFRETIETSILAVNSQVLVSSLLDHDLFQNGYIVILNFLNNITVKSSEEKYLFFSELHHKLRDLPADLVANRLLHLLLSRFVLVDPVADEVFLAHLLTPITENESEDSHPTDIIPLLPEHLYKQCCIPILSKLFEVNDRHVRMILLKYFHLYVAMFEKDVLKNVILYQLNVGLRGCDDELVSATFSALQYLVPVLGSQTVLGSDKRGLGGSEGGSYFTDRRPRFQSQGFKVATPDEYHEKPKSLATNLARNTLLAKVKLNNESRAVEEKTKELERRKQETKRRNEERREKSKLLRMKKEMAKKATKVEEDHGKSDANNFQPWEDMSPENDLNVEVSDCSEHGRPSSSEVSLDSGYSERNRVQSSLPSPVFPPNINNGGKKSPSRKPAGMKLTGKSKLHSQNKGSNSPLSPSNDRLPVSQDKATSLFSNGVAKKNAPSRTYEQKAIRDVPWDEFDIKVTKKPSTQADDIFSDMAPSIAFVPKAPVKGTSMYSDTLAVESTSNELVAGDGWMNDDW